MLLQSAALAQVARPPKDKDWTIGVGFAPIYSPARQGNRSQSLSIFPYLRVNYREALFFSVPDGLGWNIINQNGWQIGPLFKFRFGFGPTSAD